MSKMFTFIFVSVFLYYPLTQAESEHESEYYNTVEGTPPENVVFRPCPSFDVTCVSWYLKMNSYCIYPSTTRPNKPVKVMRQDIDLPALKISITRLDLKFKNVLAGKIEEFFVDFQGEATVISFLFNNVSIETKNSIYEQHRRANVPAIENTPTKVTYPQLAVTIVFHTIRNLDLSQAKITGYAISSPEHRAEYPGDSIISMYENFAIATQESLWPTASLVGTIFTQMILCDYGINVDYMQNARSDMR